MITRRLILCVMMVVALGLMVDTSADAATIVSVVANGGQQDLEGDTVPDGDPFTWGKGDDPGFSAEIARKVIQDALDGGTSVTILSEGDIFVVDSIEKSGAGTPTLILEADRSISVEDAIVSVHDGLNLVLTAIDDVLVSAPVLSNGGDLAVTGTLRIEAGGEVRSNATVTGNTEVNGGKVAPGDSAGVFDVSGNLSIGAGSILEIEVGGLLNNEFDRFLVGGTAALGGTIDASLINGFAPAVGDTFDVILASGVTDLGISVTGPFSKSVVDLGGQEALRLTYVPEPVSVLLFAAAGLAMLRRS